MIRKADSANNRQFGHYLFVCALEWSFAALVFLPLKGVWWHAKWKSTRRPRMPHSLHRRKPLRPKPLSITSQVSLQKIMHRRGPVRRDAFADGGACMCWFFDSIFFGLPPPPLRIYLRQACSGARTDYTNQPCKKFKDTKGSCQTASARSPRVPAQQLMENKRDAPLGCVFSHLVK